MATPPRSASSPAGASPPPSAVRSSSGPKPRDQLLSFMTIPAGFKVSDLGTALPEMPEKPYNFDADKELMENMIANLDTSSPHVVDIDDIAPTEQLPLTSYPGLRPETIAAETASIQAAEAAKAAAAPKGGKRARTGRKHLLSGPRRTARNRASLRNRRSTRPQLI